MLLGNHLALDMVGKNRGEYVDVLALLNKEVEEKLKTLDEGVKTLT